MHRIYGFRGMTAASMPSVILPHLNFTLPRIPPISISFDVGHAGSLSTGSQTSVMLTLLSSDQSSLPLPESASVGEVYVHKYANEESSFSDVCPAYVETSGTVQ